LKLTGFISTLVLVLLLSACGQKDETTSMANPNKYNIGKDEMIQMTGIDISAPYNAEEVQYSVIGYESDNPMSEVRFKLDGDEYCYRAQTANSEISLADTMSLMNEKNFEYANISGIYTTWKTMAIVETNKLSGVWASDKKHTLIVWNDGSGITYNLSVDKMVPIEEQRQLLELVDSIFVPIQDDSTGNTSSMNIIGTWTQNNSDKDYYLVLELKDDGSGSLMSEPEDMGLPLNYEIDGTHIITHIGDTDDNTPMEYNPDTDQIIYGDICFSR